MRAFHYTPAGAVLRYYDLPGTGSPWVFLHGLGAAALPAFLDVVEIAPLAEHRRLLIDFLGHGFSDRPADFAYTMEEHADSIVRLLEHLNVQRATFVGHSMGGSIAILCARQAPDRVERLIVAEPNLDPGPGVLSGAITAEGEAEFVAMGREGLLAAVASTASMEYAAAIRIADPMALYRSAISLIAPRRPTYREILERLPLSRTLVYGERNADEFDRGRLAGFGVYAGVVPNAGHDMMADNPSGMAAALAAAGGCGETT